MSKRLWKIRDGEKSKKQLEEEGEVELTITNGRYEMELIEYESWDNEIWPEYQYKLRQAKEFIRKLNA